VRLFEQGQLESAQQLLSEVTAFEFENAHASLWIADAARRIGDDELAETIEMDLFDRKVLNDWRLSELLERMVAAGDTGRVLEYGEMMVERRQPMRILELMEKVATESGDELLAEKWTARIDDAKRAREEIEAYQEEQRNAQQQRGQSSSVMIQSIRIP